MRQSEIEAERAAGAAAPVVWMEYDTAGVHEEHQLGDDPVRSFGIMLQAFERRSEPEEVTRFLRMVGHAGDDLVRWWLSIAMIWRFDHDGALGCSQHSF